MPVEAIVVLCLTVAILMTVLRHKWKWPKGHRVAASYKKVKAHLIYNDEAATFFEFSPEETARRCAVAANSLLEAWADVKEDGEKTPDLSEIVVHVLGNDAFELAYDDALEKLVGNEKFNAAGTLSFMERKGGFQTMPIVACRANNFNYFDSTPTTGGLVVHELVHHIIRTQGFGVHDAGHSKPRYWIGPGQDASLEGRARIIFQQNVTN